MTTKSNEPPQIATGWSPLRIILVALIPIISLFSYSLLGTSELKREVRGLRSEVRPLPETVHRMLELEREVSRLKKSVEAQSAEIRQLRERLPPPRKTDNGKGKP